MNILKKALASTVFALLFCAQSAVADITTGLLAHYEFEGNVSDSSGNDRNLSVSGGGSASFAVGKIGSAYSLNGTDNYLSAINALTAQGGGTIAFWVKGISPQVAFDTPIAVYGTKNAGVYGLFTQLSIGDGNAGYDTYPTSFGDNNWHHVVITFDGTVNSSNIYFDSALQPGTHHNENPGLGENIYIGWSGTTGYEFNGTIDDVRIYNRTLTTTDISELYLSALKTINVTTQNLSAGGVELNVSSDLNGTMYYVLGTSSFACPSAYDIKMALPSGGIAPIKMGYMELNSSINSKYFIKDLNASTAYRICAVGADVYDQYTPVVELNITTLSVPTQLPYWSAVGTAGFSDSNASKTSIATDSKGDVYVAYADASLGNRVTVKKYSNSFWSTVGTQGFSPNGASFISLAVSAHGVPHVAFVDDVTTFANVMKFDGSTWSALGTSVSGTAAQYTSLAFDNNDTPHVAYQDVAVSGKATVKKFASGAWSPLFGAAFSNANSIFESLAFSPKGEAHVAVSDGTYSYGLSGMRFDLNSSTWWAVGSYNASGGQASYVSLAFSHDGIPYVAYQSALHANKSSVMAFSGGAWSLVGSGGFSNSSVADTSIAFGPDGLAYMAYRDFNTTTKANAMFFNGTAWTQLGNADFSNGSANDLSFAISAQGVPYVAFSDGSQANKLTVMALNSSSLIIPTSNIPPYCHSAQYVTAQGVPLTQSLSPLCADDLNQSGLVYTITAGSLYPSGAGELNVTADGNFTFTPLPSFVGTVSFSYSAFDGSSSNAPVAVTIVVVPSTTSVIGGVAAAKAKVLWVGSIATAPTAGKNTQFKLFAQPASANCSIVKYWADFNDSTPVASFVSSTIEHNFSVAGSYLPRFWAEDCSGSGEEYAYSYAGFVVYDKNTDIQTHTYSLASGWNLISLPDYGEMTLGDINDTFNKSGIAVLFKYNSADTYTQPQWNIWVPNDNGSYLPYVNRMSFLKSREGAWVKTTQAMSIDISMLVSATSLVSVPNSLKTGWNLVGADDTVTTAAGMLLYSQAPNLFATKSADACIAPSVLWRYNGSTLSWEYLVNTTEYPTLTPPSTGTPISDPNLNIYKEGVWILVPSNGTTMYCVNGQV